MVGQKDNQGDAANAARAGAPPERSPSVSGKAAIPIAATPDVAGEGDDALAIRATTPPSASAASAERAAAAPYEVVAGVVRAGSSSTLADGGRLLAGHTPGPWQDIGDGYVEAQSAPLRLRPGWHDYAYLQAGPEGQAEWQANARLIAAAPELLEALEICLAIEPRALKKATNLSGQSPYDIGLAAIQKARGQ